MTTKTLPEAESGWAWLEAELEKAVLAVVAVVP
jgi:hypothetical protein